MRRVLNMILFSVFLKFINIPHLKIKTLTNRTEFLQSVVHVWRYKKPSPETKRRKMPAVKRHRWSDGRFSYDAKECEAAVVIQNAWTCTFAMDLSKQRAQRYLKICPTPEKTKSMM